MEGPCEERTSPGMSDVAALGEAQRTVAGSVEPVEDQPGGCLAKPSGKWPKARSFAPLLPSPSDELASHQVRSTRGQRVWGGPVERVMEGACLPELRVERGRIPP